MDILLYNSLTNQKEKFEPIDQSSNPPLIKMYSCGPTVYDFAHIGNFRSFLFSDLLHRLFITLGYEVRLVMNITDIDDKTITGSQKEQVSLKEYTQKYTQAFYQDIKNLNCLPASEYPLATEHIPEMTEMIKRLLHEKYAYISDGSVYFDINSFGKYGALSNIDLSEQKAGANDRVQADEYSKNNISDFVLWKKYSQEDGEIYWEDKVLGKGRPGWHIECSAMSKKTLGEHFDVHTGGIDNKFPHHENEIAQSSCSNKCDYVNYWLHCSHLLVDNQKMSKSLGNFYTLRDLTIKSDEHNYNYDPLAIRYLLLSAHYRTNLNFTLEGITAAEKSILKVNRLIQTLYLQQRKKNNTDDSGDNNLINNIEKKKMKFLSYLSNDLNVSGALGVVFDMVNVLNKNINDLNLKEIQTSIEFFKRANSIFATFKLSEEKNSDANDNSSLEELPTEVENLANQRIVARENKDFELSDKIRDQIKDLGYEIIDTPEGAKYEKIY